MQPQPEANQSLIRLEFSRDFVAKKQFGFFLHICPLPPPAYLRSYVRLLDWLLLFYYTGTAAARLAVLYEEGR